MGREILMEELLCRSLIGMLEEKKGWNGYSDVTEGKK